MVPLTVLAVVALHHHMITYSSHQKSSPGGKTIPPGGRRASSPDSQTGKPSRSQPSQNRAQQNTKSKQNHIFGAFSQATHFKTHNDNDDDYDDGVPVEWL